MKYLRLATIALAVLIGSVSQAAAQTAPREIGPATMVGPHAVTGGFELPNGWRITPAGQSVGVTGDLVLKIEIGRASCRERVLELV